MYFLHNNFFRCKAKDCEKAFSSKFKLIRHELIHQGEKKHMCPYCQKSFTRKDHLKNHLKVSSVFPYILDLHVAWKLILNHHDSNLHQSIGKQMQTKINETRYTYTWKCGHGASHKTSATGRVSI